MELLYVWINRSKNKFYEQKGINFSPEYNFIVEHQDETWVLYEDETWEKNISIFKDDIIENVTAVVGRNGSGKTTLLEYLSRLTCIPPQMNERQEYERYQEDKNEHYKYIYVLKEEDSIFVYHSLEHNFLNMTKYDEKAMYGVNYTEKRSAGENGFDDILKVYLSNSTFGSIQRNDVTRETKLDGISLTPSGISTIGKMFFDKLLGLNTFVNENNLVYLWKNILKQRLDLQHFQSICDILYFDKLIREDKIESYEINISSTISVSSKSAAYLLFSNYPENITTEKTLFLNKLCDNIGKLSKKIHMESNQIVRNMTLNLLFEICMDLEDLYPQKIMSISQALEWIEEICIDLREKDYYLEALKEIGHLNEIMQSAFQKENFLPQNDSAYDDSMVFNRDKNKIAYNRFIEFIVERFNSKHSFILRYISIKSIGMSSGERAFQNFFSWINLMPIFNSIDTSIPKEMRNTILILIDEIDLYLHPDWQRKFLFTLLEEIHNQFSSYKVQVVFATHSPLCLSDVPRDNIIYLLGNGEIEDRRNCVQTFGKDVYSLLNDAFYLDGHTMGQYAKTYIDNIIEEMFEEKPLKYKKLPSDEIEKLKMKISVLGNDILKNKLLSMLKNCYYSKDDELELLYDQRKKIEERILELEK